MDTGFNPVQEKKEKVFLGLLGAFLFSLAGAVVWVILDMIGFIAALSGLVGVFCAIQGYRIFAGKLSKKGIIFSVIIAFLVLVLAWYGCLAWDVMKASQEWYASGEIEAPFTYGQAFSVAFLLLTDMQVLKSYGLSLLLGLGFAILGSIGTIKTNFGRVNAEKAAKQQMADPAIAEKFGKPAEQVPDIYAEPDKIEAQPDYSRPDGVQPDEFAHQSGSQYDRTPGDEKKY